MGHDLYAKCWVLHCRSSCSRSTLISRSHWVKTTKEFSLCSRRQLNMFRVHCRHKTTLELHDTWSLPLWHMETKIDNPKDNHIFARYRKTSLGNASRTVDVISFYFSISFLLFHSSIRWISLGWVYATWSIQVYFFSL